MVMLTLNFFSRTRSLFLIHLFTLKIPQTVEFQLLTLTFLFRIMGEEFSRFQRQFNPHEIGPVQTSNFMCRSKLLGSAYVKFDV